MRYWKRAGALLAAGALLLGLTACGSSITDDATVYVQGLLDANYKGEISQDYIDVVEDMTGGGTPHRRSDTAGPGGGG